MASTTSHGPAVGLPTSARTVLEALPGESMRLLVLGGIGSGKSTALEAVRRSLREAGQTVVARPPGPHDRDCAVVVDDAHLLNEADLRALTDLADEPDRTVVVAAEPRDHDASLRSLATALCRERDRIILGPLQSGEISRLLSDPAGHPPASTRLNAALAATAGIPFLVSALVDEQRNAPGLSVAGMIRTTELAMMERLRRLEQADLEALAIASLSTDLGAADLAATLGVPVQRGLELVDRARGTGLLQPSHPAGLLRSVHRAVTHLVGTARHHELEKALLRTQLDSESLSLDLALELAEHGLRDESLARWLRDRTGNADTGMRVAIHRAAVAAGAEDVRPGLADALALAGDCPAAVALADGLLGSAQPADRAAGVRVAASVAVHYGNAAHAAELFDWLGPYPDAAFGAASALVHAATGNLIAARAALEAGTAGPPTAAARSARGLAEGVLLSIEAPYPSAAIRLGQTLTGGHRGAGVMPDSAAAVVTLAAINSGDSARARSVIGRAVRENRDGTGDPLFFARHRLLQAWVRMQDGQAAAAAGDADVEGTRGRDALWAAALRTAIARRGGDAGSLQTHWAAGMDVLAEYSVDLFSLLPLGELWIAGARLRQQDRLAPAVEQGFAVLAALGDPPAWAAQLRWAGVHAGILAGNPAAVAPHGQALTAMAGRSPFAAALAAAGRAWLRVLANQVDPDEVVAAARGLAGFGLTSDATRLASQAALYAQEGKVSGQMLQAARDLKLSVVVDADPSPAADAGGPAPDRRQPPSTALSDREREVAELLLLGMPYRDIGSQLFISAKTVEHHVARIRRRLGAESRSEMLSMLRAMLAGESPGN